MSYTERLSARARGTASTLTVASPHPFADSSSYAPDAFQETAREPSPLPFTREGPRREDGLIQAIPTLPVVSERAAPPSAPRGESAPSRGEPEARLTATSTLATSAAQPPPVVQPLPTRSQPAPITIETRVEHTREVVRREHTREQHIERLHQPPPREPGPTPSAPTPVAKGHELARPERQLSPRLESVQRPAQVAPALPPIHVHIGRIVVSPEPARAVRTRRERAPAVAAKSLAQHLADRRGRR